MSKLTWERPRTLVQEFEPNVCETTCSSGTVYKFECNAGDSSGKYDVVLDNGTNLTPDEHYWDGTTTIYYHPCGKTHESPTSETYYSGKLYFSNGNDDRIRNSRSIPVLIWTDGGTNVHCTTNLNKEDWEVAKS